MDSDSTQKPQEFGPSFFVAGEEFTPTVLAWRPHSEWDTLQGEVVRSDAGVAELLLGFMRGTAVARNDESRLLEVIADFAFRAFPHATHHVLVARDDANGEMRPLVARSREGQSPQIALSRTIVARVMDERCALLFARGLGHFEAVHSAVMSKLETAICAPLMGSRYPFGVIQLDIRHPGKGRFSRADVDLLSVFAGQAGLALEHLQMAKQQRRAFQSTIGALVYSLTLKDPAAARHSERVQAISLELGRRLSLSSVDLEILSVSALLHDLGKQGVRDELLFKPQKLSEAETNEMAQHAAYTQSILDMIEFPEELREVPRIAAYHHEKLDGTGPFGVAGADIPIHALIISVADVFDALVSPRPYKNAMSPGDALAIVRRGSGSHWDKRVVGAMEAALPSVLVEVYALKDSPPIPPAAPEAEDEDPPMAKAA